MEALPNFQFHHPETVADAVRGLHEDGAARLVAGGTDLIVNIRRGLEEPTTLIDISNIQELRRRTAADGGYDIGASVTLDEVATDPIVQQDYPAVAQAAASVAGPTHRNYGTVGGNLCLDTRCIYYNQSGWWRRSNNFCLKYQGDVCHVAPKSSRCFATFSGDLAAALLIHDAEVDIAGPAGSRRMPLGELYTGDGIAYLSLQPGEVLVGVHLPADRAGIPSAYGKSRIRGSIDFPLAGIAVSLVQKGGIVTELRAALTALDVRPYLVEDTEAFHDAPVDGDAIRRFGELARQAARPMRTTTVPPWYRRRVVAGIARRLLRQLADV